MTETSLALGSFDGLHVGHIEVLRQALACENPTALLFSVPPAMVMSGKSELLQSPEDKKRRLEELGFTVFEMDFAAVRNMEAEEFLSFLKQRFNPRKICCGFNYRFGKNASGDTSLLSRFCKENEIAFSCTPPVERDGERVSSSRIRALIADGHPEKAEEMLSRPFSVTGLVRGGDRRGRTWGFPTANFYYPENLIMPRHGVYAAECDLDGKSYKAVCYIGLRPTYSLKEPIVETFLLDFSGDIYESELTVKLKRFVRPDRRFESAEELKKQIALDIESVRG